MSAPRTMNLSPTGLDRADDSASVTIRYLKHELRTPINHIIGYAEMLLEDLTDRGDAQERAAVETMHTIGKELLALVNAAFDASVAPDAEPPPELLASLRASVQRSVDRIHLTSASTRLMADTASSEDLRK